MGMGKKAKWEWGKKLNGNGDENGIHTSDSTHYISFLKIKNLQIFSHSSSFCFSTVTVATVTVQLPNHKIDIVVHWMATLPSRKMFISSSSIKPTQDPIQLATDELESKLRNGEAFSAIFFHLLATPARNPSSQASEAKLNHRRDLQEVQLARTSSSRVCRNPPPGHLLAPTLFPSCRISCNLLKFL
ncbi:hypothetical protein PRUPE_1G564200 [Prunus persica]|uniref:Uncharacterized protein n=1 Tax=Prunus persica TaxID=3760 RepID=A0A251RLY2_PRUPE|nr:hypothetical protein PRUPE_1G564200 [Prunus persica]